jgi:hypothetical protein
LIRAHLIVKNFTVNNENADQDEVQQTNDVQLAKQQEQKAPVPSIVPVKSDAEKMALTQEYKWISSTLLEAIDVERQATQAEIMFSEPLSHWNEDAWCYVRWVSVRLRCLIGNILRLSNLRTVDANTVREISRAFTEIGESVYFKYITRDYLFILL